MSVLGINPFIPKVKSWAIETFLSLDAMERPLTFYHPLGLQSHETVLNWALIYCSILDLSLVGVKAFKD